ncbi:MAG: glycosyltransferase family 2 protein [Proteobacteria bacterium]|nr:glycosyltransferase family 2 protein [Pseudomonadota bacterium]
MFNLLKKLAPSRAKKNPTDTGVAIVAMIGNECDIIELFLRHNQPFCDKFYIVLHNSLDTTGAIIKNLQAEGFAIDVQISNQMGYEQKTITEAAIRAVANENRYDYIVPLDADEFLPYDGQFQNIHKMTANDFGTMTWQTFVPMDADYFIQTNPLLGFRARSFESIAFTKVVLGVEYAKTCTLSLGNHNAPHENNIPAIDLGITLQHFPLRSAEQMVRKSLFGVYASLLRSNRAEGESYHWYDMLRDIRTKNYQIEYAEVLQSALRFASKDEDSDENPVATPDINSPPSLDKQIKIRYQDLTAINLVKDMDGFITRWIASDKNG